MKRIVSLLVVFSIILSSFNISFAEGEIIISGLYPIKGDKIRLMSFESNLDFDTFIQDEEYIFKNESDKAQNIEIGLNKDNGIRLPKVKVADQDIQLREAKDKYSFNIDLDKGEYKKVELSYEVRVNNADEERIKYNTDTLGKWYKDIIEFRAIYDLREYLEAEVDYNCWDMDKTYLDDFNRIIIEKSNFYIEDFNLYLNVNNEWKSNKKSENFKQMRKYAHNGEYIKALEIALNEEVWRYYDYFAAEYYISDMYDEKAFEELYEKTEIWLDEYGIMNKVNWLTNRYGEEKILKGKVILLNVEKQNEKAEIYYYERPKEAEIEAEYSEKLNKLSNEVEEVAPNSNIYVPKLDAEDIQKPYGRDEYRRYDQYDYNNYLASDLYWNLEGLGATVISIPEHNQLLSNKERIDIANENDVHMVITIGNSEEEEGCYITYPSDKYIKDKELNSINKKLSEYIDNALVSMEEDEYTSIKRQKKQDVSEKTIFNWSNYPIIGLKMFLVNEYGYYDSINTYPIGEKIVEFFNNKDVQAYYASHPRELEKQELELVKEKLKAGHKVTEDEVMTEVELENTMKNNSVLMIIGISIAATAVAAILTFVVIKLIKRLRRKKDEQKENSSDSE